MGVVAVGAAFLAVRLVLVDDGSRVERARDRALAAGRAGTAAKAGESLAAAGELLQAEAAACDTRAGGVACSAWRSAAAYAQVAAVEVLGCTAPGRAEASASLARYIDEVANATESVPEPPPMPECAFGRRGRRAR